MKFIWFVFAVFFLQITYKVKWIYKSWWLYLKNCIKIDQTVSIFYLKKDFNLIKKGIILAKKLKIQVIISMITFTRSSGWIFNSSTTLVLYYCSWLTSSMYTFKILCLHLCSQILIEVTLDLNRSRIQIVYSNMAVLFFISN